MHGFVVVVLQKGRKQNQLVFLTALYLLYCMIQVMLIFATIVLDGHIKAVHWRCTNVKCLYRVVKRVRNAKKEWLSKNAINVVGFLLVLLSFEWLSFECLGLTHLLVSLLLFSFLLLSLATRCSLSGDPFCDSCYDLQHRSGTKKRHTFKGIEVIKEILKDAEEYCSVCNVRAADRACDPCGDPYCSRCFKETHKTANKKGHSWTPWSKIRTGRDWVQINDEVSGEILYFNVKTRKTQSNKPTGLMSGLERDIEKKRLLAEKEMSARLDKERELIRLRQETTSMGREMKMTSAQLEEAQKVQLPKRRSFFSSVIKKPSNLLNSRIVAYKIKQENHEREKEFLRSRLITTERDEEIAHEAKKFGSDRHADTVVDELIGGLKK